MLGLGTTFAAVIALGAVVEAHTVITYPGWRGNNLHTNGTLPQDDPSALPIEFDSNGTNSYPWGMQWLYPCGGMPQSTNRTNWPVTGGALAFQPGWFRGHQRGLVYVNIGIQEDGQQAPPNMSHNVVPPFQIISPTNEMYNGTVCLPQIPMPADIQFRVGQNITLQLIETAQHGAALYNCVDVTLTEPQFVEEITPSNCFNSSSMGFQSVFTSANLNAATGTIPSPPVAVALISMALVAFFI